MTVPQVVAAVLLPPLGVYLTRGTGREFWIAVVLTLIAFVPGLVFALWVVSRGEPTAPRNREGSHAQHGGGASSHATA